MLAQEKHYPEAWAQLTGCAFSLLFWLMNAQNSTEPDSQSFKCFGCWRVLKGLVVSEEVDPKAAGDGRKPLSRYSLHVLVDAVSDDIPRVTEALGRIAPQADVFLHKSRAEAMIAVKEAKVLIAIQTTDQSLGSLDLVNALVPHSKLDQSSYELMEARVLALQRMLDENQHSHCERESSLGRQLLAMGREAEALKAEIRQLHADVQKRRNSWSRFLTRPLRMVFSKARWQRRP